MLFGSVSICFAARSKTYRLAWSIPCGSPFQIRRQFKNVLTGHCNFWPIRSREVFFVWIFLSSFLPNPTKIFLGDFAQTFSRFKPFWERICRENFDGMLRSGLDTMAVQMTVVANALQLFESTLWSVLFETGLR